MKFTVQSPGKVILFGEHAVVFGSPAIATSIGLNCYFDVTVNEDSSDQIEIEFQNELKSKFKLSKLTLISQSIQNESELLAQSWNIVTELLTNFDKNEATHNCVAQSLCVCIFLFLRAIHLKPSNVIDRIQTIFNSKQSVNIIINSDIPNSVGLGSSSAFTVAATVTALILTGHIRLKCNWTPDSFEIETIKFLARDAECIIHGRSSGLDTSVSTHGGVIQYQLNKSNFVKQLHISSDRILKLLVVNSSIKRSTGEAVQRVCDKKDQEPEQMNQIFQNIESIVWEASDIFTQQLNTNSLNKLSTLVVKNQHLLTQMGVSHPVIDRIIEDLRSFNISAKLTGAGCGGCLIGIVPDDSQYDEKCLNQVISKLEENSFWAKIVPFSSRGVDIKLYSN